MYLSMNPIHHPKPNHLYTRVDLILIWTPHSQSVHLKKKEKSIHLLFPYFLFPSLLRIPESLVLGPTVPSWPRPGLFLRSRAPEGVEGNRFLFKADDPGGGGGKGLALNFELFRKRLVFLAPFFWVPWDPSPPGVLPTLGGGRGVPAGPPSQA